jgi:putative CocE/NonD family hydrolase
MRPIPVVFLALILGGATGIAPAPPVVQPEPTFTRTDAMIPMRDGVKLYTEILVPARAAGRAAAASNAGESLPILITRTPYGVLDDEDEIARGMAIYQELARDGYIFVFQDIRGRYKSEGTFVMQRPPRRDRSDPRAVDESPDAYDTIDWLLKNVRGHNGRVGMLGISYGGWLTTMAMLDPHPALKAVAEQASPADMFLGDDFHHNGAFRLSYGFEYATEMETGRENYFFRFDRADLYDW